MIPGNSTKAIESCRDCLSSHIPNPYQAGAAEKGVPLYRHIADLAGNKKLVSKCSNRRVNFCSLGTRMDGISVHFTAAGTACASFQHHQRRHARW